VRLMKKSALHSLAETQSLRTSAFTTPLSMASLTADEGVSVEQHFWGMVLGPKNPFTLSLTQTELQITQVTLLGGGEATLYASTPAVDALPLCVLGPHPLPRSALLDLNFFPEDESVTLIVKGEGSISVAGTIAIRGGMPDNPDDEGQESSESGKKVKGDAPLSKQQPPSSVFQPQDEEVAEEGDDEEEDEDLAALLEGLEDEEDEEEEEEEEEEKEEKVVVPPPAAPKRKREDEPKKPAPPAIPAAGTERPGASGSDEWRLVPGSEGKVRFRDTAIGGGEEARKGCKVVVAYKGTLKSGRMFDQSKSFSFNVMKGEVIKGWDVGVAGMKVGGVRDLIIHPDYGCEFFLLCAAAPSFFTPPLPPHFSRLPTPSPPFLLPLQTGKRVPGKTSHPTPPCNFPWSSRACTGKNKTM
jgi:FK506-binding nuclear protein